MTNRNITTHDDDAVREGRDRAAAVDDDKQGPVSTGHGLQGRDGQRDAPPEHAGPVHQKGAPSGSGRSASRSERGATFPETREHEGDTGPESARGERRHRPKS